MNPIEPTAEQVVYWTERDPGSQEFVVMGGPEEGPDVIPCPSLVCREANVVHVAYRLDEIEVAALAQGGTLWLTTWGGLPIHLIEVVATEREPAERRDIEAPTQFGSTNAGGER